MIYLTRTLRHWLYRVSSSTFFGIDVDLLLHFMFGVLIFHFTQKHFGTRLAVWFLGATIIAKEVVDIFVKSQVGSIRTPSISGLLDIGTDILFGVLGGLAAWAMHRNKSKEPHKKT